jgi:GT2 family glycosyltransferase
MDKELPLVYVGIVIHEGSTAKYLPYFLASLSAQSYDNFKVLVFNNGDGKGENVNHIKQLFPKALILGDGGNLGFSVAYNRMMKKAVEDKADYFWVTNVDIVYNDDVLEKLVSRLKSDEELGSVCPKLLKWDYESDFRTDIVDTYGLEIKDGLRFFDIGQGQKDRFDFRYYNVLGPSGASGLYRLAALERVKEKEGYFDENFFMYKEDCDLAYRLFLAEWESAVVPEAVGWHDRTAAAAGQSDWSAIRARFKKGDLVRARSFRNQQVIFLKYWNLQSLASKAKVVIYEMKALVFASLFERPLLKEALDVWRKRDVFTRYG